VVLDYLSSNNLFNIFMMKLYSIYVKKSSFLNLKTL